MTVFYVNSQSILVKNKILDALNYISEFINHIKDKYIKRKSNNDQLKYKVEVNNFLDFLEETEETISDCTLFKENELIDFINVKEMTAYILKDSNL